MKWLPAAPKQPHEVQVKHHHEPTNNTRQKQQTCQPAAARIAAVVTSGPVLACLLFGGIHLLLILASKRHHVPSTAPHLLLAKRDLSSQPQFSPGEDEHHIETPSFIPYLDWFNQLRSATEKAPAFVLLVFWLLFLFAFVGIIASDFFCPCLSTISSYLGLSESVAGSTLLAFGNGSPDVFSTFASMGAQSGSLAIGELLGAASFIMGVVAGTMMIVRPFKVTRHVFLRDVSFFLLADLLVLLILWDSQITRFEAGALVLLYVLYVVVVGLGTWWHTRRERQRELLKRARGHFTEEDDEEVASLHTPAYEAFHDEEDQEQHSTGPSSGATTPFTPPPGSPGTNTRAPSLTRPTVRGRSISVAVPTATSAKRPPTHVRQSLLSAIEFRDVVKSLSQNSSAKGLSQFENHLPPAQRPKSQGRAKSDFRKVHTRPQHRKAASLAEVEQLTQNQETGHVFDGSVWDRPEQPMVQSDLIDLSSGVEDPWRTSAVPSPAKPRLSLDTNVSADGAAQGPSEDGAETPKPPPQQIKRVPSIVLTGEDGAITPVQVASPAREPSSTPATPALPRWKTSSDRQGHLRRIIRAISGFLFPSLSDFKEKSYLGVFAAIASSPAILVLNLTLPVVDEASFDESFHEEEEKAYESAQNESDSDYEEEEEPDDEEGRRQWQQRARYRDERIAHRLHSPAAPARESVVSPSLTSPLDLSEVDRQLVSPSERQQQRRTFSQDSAAFADEIMPPPSPEGPDEKQRKADVAVSKWMIVLECVLCPFFCVLALLGDQLQWWFFVVAAGLAVGLGIMARLIVRDTQGRGRVLFCVVGFFVSMVWLLLTVNEIVGVLQAVGHVLGLSDSILGLTVFALGNSTADLVANWTIAQMGYPMMAISACYGGPLLNTLLGIGLSGSWYIAQDKKPYDIDFDPTLVTTCIGIMCILATTALMVIGNQYRMTKKMGFSLLVAYAVLTAVNVIVEVHR